MATFTPNLTLELQEPGERASLVVLNTNLGKIDEFAGKHGVAALSTVADVTALENSLLTFGQSMGAECRHIAITFSAASGIFGATRYIGEIRRIFSDVERYRVTLYRNNSSDVVEGTYNGSAWTWDKLALNSKTAYNGTANGNYISALEGKVVKNGSFVSGYFVLTVNADFSAANLTLISDLPAAYDQDVQLLCIGLSGTNIYKASRVRITTSGAITTWYGLSFKSGESYLISVNYICA